MSEEAIRAKALELAVHVQTARGVSEPKDILILAEWYASYIRSGIVPPGDPK